MRTQVVTPLRSLTSASVYPKCQRVFQVFCCVSSSLGREVKQTRAMLDCPNSLRRGGSQRGLCLLDPNVHLLISPVLPLRQNLANSNCDRLQIVLA